MNNMNKLEDLKANLELAKTDLKSFKKENNAVFDKAKELKNVISQIEKDIKNELSKSKPKFPVENLDLGIFSSLFSNWGKEKITQEHIDNYLSEDDEASGLELILGWSVECEDDSASTHTDGDWYDYSIEVTSPEGYVYRASGETCLAVGEEFDGMELE